MAEYTVVLRAPSSARFTPEQGQEINLLPGPQIPHQLRIRMRTRWEDSGFSAPLPRELLVEVKGFANSLDEAISHFSAVSRPFTQLLAFCTNSFVGRIEAHIAFDSTGGVSEREFLEIFIPDEKGSPTEGRIVKTSEYTTLVDALLKSTHGRRIGQALQHYEIALRYWYLGGEYLSMAHLYMAVETLTPPILRLECHLRGLSKKELARSVNIDPDDPDRPRWSPALDSWCRSEVIFQGDTTTYTNAKTASDGLEHGFLELGKINSSAIAAIEATFRYVRISVLRLLDLRSAIDSELGTRPPRDVQSLRKMVRGHLLAKSDEIALPEEEYPRLEWTSGVDKVVREGDRFEVGFRETLTVRCAPGVQFRGQAIEIHGRDEPGGLALSAPGIGDESIDVTVTSEADAKEWCAILRRARSLATGIANDALTKGINPLAYSIFARLSLQIALAESVELLLLDDRPVEALGLVRGVIECAATFEGFEQAMDDAVATAVRSQLDSMDRLAAVYEDADEEPPHALAANRSGLAQAASLTKLDHGQSIRIKEAAYYLENRESIAFAQEVETWSELAAQLHSENSDGGLIFSTRVKSTKLQRAASGNCIRALTYSATIFAELFELEVDLGEISLLDADGARLQTSP